MRSDLEPAYPLVYPDDGHQYCGLTKREYFAALAMQGLCSRVELSTEERARYAVENADDLLAELERSA